MPRHATPRHATPHHATPRHITPHKSVSCTASTAHTLKNRLTTRNSHATEQQGPQNVLIRTNLPSTHRAFTELICCLRQGSRPVQVWSLTLLPNCRTAYGWHNTSCQHALQHHDLGVSLAYTKCTDVDLETSTRTHLTVAKKTVAVLEPATRNTQLDQCTSPRRCCCMYRYDV